MFEEFDQLAVVPTPVELKARFDAPVLRSERTPEERRVRDAAKRRLRFEIGQRLRVLRLGDQRSA